jgi:hypothetical protein
MPPSRRLFRLNRTRCDWILSPWRLEMFVPEDGRVLCNGGAYAAIDVSLYLVEKATIIQPVRLR